MVRFIIDSTFGVAKAYAEANKIEVVDLALILDGVVREEGPEEEWNTFYEAYRASHNFPTTSQPNPESYDDAVQRIRADEPDADILILTIASGLSGTVNSARLAAERYPGKVFVFDTMNVSACCRIMLEEAVAFVKAGTTVEDTIAFLESLKPRLSVQFIPDTMKYLKKGGRVGTLSAILASIIYIKPIFDFRNNATSVPAKGLGMNKAVGLMIKRLPESIKRLSVLYISEDKHVPLICGQLKVLRGIEDAEVSAVSPVFGIHVGIGAVGIACLSK